MSKRHFWRLTPPKQNELLAKWNDKEVLTEVIKCPTNPGHQRSGKRLTPLSVYLPRHYGQDFIWTWQSDCLISRRALDVFVKCNLTGFEAKPAITRFNNSRVKTPEFSELRPIGWGGIALPSSGVELIDFCESCGSTDYSALTHPECLIDQTQWDGSDLFIVWPMPRFILISDRAREVIMENQLSGATIESVENLKSRIGMGFSPGKLEYWFPNTHVKAIKAKYDGIE
jgi:hypothetical protein